MLPRCSFFARKRTMFSSSHHTVVSLSLSLSAFLSLSLSRYDTRTLSLERSDNVEAQRLRQRGYTTTVDALQGYCKVTAQSKICGNELFRYARHVESHSAEAQRLQVAGCREARLRSLSLPSPPFMYGCLARSLSLFLSVRHTHALSSGGTMLKHNLLKQVADCREARLRSLLEIGPWYPIIPQPSSLNTQHSTLNTKLSTPNRSAPGTPSTLDS